MGRKHGWAGLALALLLAACRQGAPEPGVPVEVRLLDRFGEPGLGYVAVQVEDGPWTALPPDAEGRYLFTLPAPGSRYGVAVSCWVEATLEPPPHALALRTLFLYQLTGHDTRRPVFPCAGLHEPALREADVAFDAQAVGGAWVWILTDAGGFFAKSAAGTLRVRYREGGLLAITGSGTVIPEHYLALRHLPGPPPEALRFGDADRVEHHQGQLALDSATGRGVVNLGLFRMGGVGVATLLARENDLTEPFPRFEGLGPEYLYLLDAHTEESPWFAGLWANPSADRVHLEGQIPGFPTEAFVSPSTFPRFQLRARGAAGYWISLLEFRSFIPINGSVYYLSAGWLAERSAYTLPDLGSLPGFAGTPPQSGVATLGRVAAIFADEGLGPWLESPYWAGGMHTSQPVRPDSGYTYAGQVFLILP